jgi:prepilin peptidase CpaA
VAGAEARVLAKIVLFLFPAAMAYAAASDLLTMRISNRLVLAMVAGFLLVALLMNMSWQEFGMHLAVGAVVLAATFTFFAFGWIGGGDAKLAAATALWLGFSTTLPYLVYASLLGGMLTFLLLAVRRHPLPPQIMNVTWIRRLHDKSTGVPYGIAMAAAGLLTYSNTTIYQHFAS